MHSVQLYAEMLKNRLEKEAKEEKRMISETQVGFRREKSTIIFVIITSYRGKEVRKEKKGKFS